MLKIYNTLTNQKDTFVPIEPGKVRMYVCGMTVYDYCHLGHARVMVVFDVVVRYLRALGYAVTYVRNITDIDDKIIRRALENGEDIHTLTNRFIAFMNEDADALGVDRPDLEPRATESMEQIIDMIGNLVRNGYAYRGENGDVYYDVSRFERYGRLSGRNLDDLQAGARIEVDEAKEDPLDFVLWKAAKSGEPSWSSPWGEGRPGWHIECSAMSVQHLGAHFDIHGGGMDLKFPHHENEIAQSEAATCKPFVNYWMHNGFVRVNDEKMSKSLGNFFTVHDILKRYRPEEVRFFIVASHYRSPLNYSQENLDNSKAALTRLYTAIRGIEPVIATDVEVEQFTAAFNTAMDDDFNTPEAIAVLFDLAREINKSRSMDPERARRLAGVVKSLGTILGLLQNDPEEFLKGQPSPITVKPVTLFADGGKISAKQGKVIPPSDREDLAASLSSEQIELWITARQAARLRKDWAEADRIRKLLEDQGVILEDAASGTTWRRS